MFCPIIAPLGSESGILYHFLLTSHCEDPTSLTVDGTPYAEVIFTYLRPSTR